MIRFLATRANEYTIRSYLRGYGAPLCGILSPMRYERLLRARRLRNATYIFSDLELLSDADRERAARVWDELAGRGCRLLNHPTRSMRRYELLRVLHQRGINRFTVHRAETDSSAVRFPVFLRGENDHLGSVTPLLRTPVELDASLDRLRRSGSILDDTIITEFCDTANDTGVYRKYSAFIVGDRIIARHVFFSDEWDVKSWKLMSDELLREELAYVESNPHEAALREIFAIARIDYGRIDYGFAGDRLQVWEINTNPTIVWPPRAPRPREAVHATFAAMLRPALEALDVQPHDARATTAIGVDGARSRRRASFQAMLWRVRARFR